MRFDEKLYPNTNLKVSSIPYLMTGFNFIVTLNEFTFGFQSVSGISINNKADYIPEGGVNDHQIMVGAPSSDNPTLTFKRGAILRNPTSLDIIAKFAAIKVPTMIGKKTALLAAAACDPQETLENGPAIGIIQVYNRERKLRHLYSFLSLGMLSWRVDDLDATSGTPLCEEITIAHTGLVRMPLDFSPVSMYVNNVGLEADEITKNNKELQELKEEEAKKRWELAEKMKELKKTELEMYKDGKVTEEELEQLNKELEEVENLKEEIETLRE